jgi:predicted SnoaL-like aldol condensation-catalyzing enzyme
MNGFMSLRLLTLFLAIYFTASVADSPKPPIKSQEQAMNQRNVIPAKLETVIIAEDKKSRERADMLIRVYKTLETDPTIENIRKYVRDDYIQHSPMLPDGPQGLAMFFRSSVVRYPVKIDVHKVMVMGDWAMAHVNFRNLDTTDPNDLGLAAIDIYTFGPEGKLAEHWDAVQGVPSHSVNPNGMFTQLRSVSLEGEK